MKREQYLILSIFAKKNKTLFVLAFLTGLVYNILTVLIPISLGRFYELSFGFSSHKMAAFSFLPFLQAPTFKLFMLAFFLLAVFRFAFEYLNKYIISLLGERFTKEIREKLFKHQLQVAPTVYQTGGTGKYLLRYSGDFKGLQDYLTKGILRFVQDVVLLAMVLTTVAILNLQLATIISAGIFTAAIVLWEFGKMLQKKSLKRRNLRSGILSFVSDRLKAIAAIKVFNRYTPEEKRYQKKSTELYRAGVIYARREAFLEAIVPLAIYSILGLTMGFAFVLVNEKDSKITASSLLVLILLIIAVLPMLRRSLRVNLTWQLGNISFTKLINILSLPTENNLPFDNTSFINKKIFFNGVSFKYPEAKSLVFNELSLNIKPLTTILILGKSGSGKTTFIKLVLKIMPPISGSIAFESISINSVSEKTIRKNIAVVSKDFPLYGRDVYEAIVYSRKKENKHKAKAILEQLQKFEPENLKLDLRTKIGDLGSNLTNGQQKLLMYCRALLTNKPILLIEEPFAGLGNKTREHLLDVLNSYKTKKTIVVLDSQHIEGLIADKVYYLEKDIEELPFSKNLLRIN